MGWGFLLGGWSPEKVGRQKPFRFHFPKAILSSSCPTAQNLPLASFCLSTKFELLYPATESSATGLNSTYHPVDFREYRLTHTHSSSVLPVRKWSPREELTSSQTQPITWVFSSVLYYITIFSLQKDHSPVRTGKMLQFSRNTANQSSGRRKCRVIIRNAGALQSDLVLILTLPWAVWSWGGYLTSLDISFLICKQGMITGLNCIQLVKIKHQSYKVVEVCLTHNRDNSSYMFCPSSVACQSRGLNKSYYVLGFIFFIGET